MGAGSLVSETWRTDGDRASLITFFFFFFCLELYALMGDFLQFYSI